MTLFVPCLLADLAPTRLRVRFIDSGSIHLSWNQPRRQVKAITAYFVQIAGACEDGSERSKVVCGCVGCVVCESGVARGVLTTVICSPFAGGIGSCIVLRSSSPGLFLGNSSDVPTNTHPMSTQTGVGSGIVTYVGVHPIGVVSLFIP